MVVEHPVRDVTVFLTLQEAGGGERCCLRSSRGGLRASCQGCDGIVTLQAAAAEAAAEAAAVAGAKAHKIQKSHSFFWVPFFLGP